MLAASTREAGAADLQHGCGSAASREPQAGIGLVQLCKGSDHGALERLTPGLPVLGAWPWDGAGR